MGRHGHFWPNKLEGVCERVVCNGENMKKGRRGVGGIIIDECLMVLEGESCNQSQISRLRKKKEGERERLCFGDSYKERVEVSQSLLQPLCYLPLGPLLESLTLV